MFGNFYHKNAFCKYTNCCKSTWCDKTNSEILKWKIHSKLFWASTYLLRLKFLFNNDKIYLHCSTVSMLKTNIDASLWYKTICQTMQYRCSQLGTYAIFGIWKLQQICATLHTSWTFSEKYKNIFLLTFMCLYIQ